MQLQELKQQAYKLSVSDRVALVNAILESLQDAPGIESKIKRIRDRRRPRRTRRLAAQSNRSNAIKRMRGLLKTDQPTPTDEEVEAMLEDRRVEKYLQ